MKLAEPLDVRGTGIAGLWRLRWTPLEDARGSVQPLFVQSQVDRSPLPRFMVSQTNLTRSCRGAIRGVHGEFVHKLTIVLEGRIFAAIVDLRSDSTTSMKHETFELGPYDGLFVSAGLGNAFQSVSDIDSLYLYLFDAEWSPGMPGRHVHPLDPALGIDWPIADSLILSAKDQALPDLHSAMQQEG